MSDPAKSQSRRDAAINRAARAGFDVLALPAGRYLALRLGGGRVDLDDCDALAVWASSLPLYLTPGAGL